MRPENYPPPRGATWPSHAQNLYREAFNHADVALQGDPHQEMAWAANGPHYAIGAMVPASSPIILHWPWGEHAKLARKFMPARRRCGAKCTNLLGVNHCFAERATFCCREGYHAMKITTAYIPRDDGSPYNRKATGAG